MLILKSVWKSNKPRIVTLCLVKRKYWKCGMHNVKMYCEALVIKVVCYIARRGKLIHGEECRTPQTPRSTET